MPPMLRPLVSVTWKVSLIELVPAWLSTSSAPVSAMIVRGVGEPTFDPEAPKAFRLSIRSDPCPTTNCPPQLPWDWLSTNVPMSFLRRLLPFAIGVKAVLSVKVLPWVTSIALLGWFSKMERVVPKVPVTRRPLPVAAFVSK